MADDILKDDDNDVGNNLAAIIARVQNFATQLTKADLRLKALQSKTPGPPEDQTLSAALNTINAKATSLASTAANWLQGGQNIP